MNDPQQDESQQGAEPRRLLIVAGPDNEPQAWMTEPEAS